jgi:hypothetical protein
MKQATWRSRIVWVALAAFGFASLAPAFVHWGGSAGAAAAQGELCSVSPKRIAPDPKPAPADHDGRDSHCPFCRLHHAVALLGDAQPVAQAQFVQPARLARERFLGAHSALDRTPGSPRAPPQTS